jgi:hypothetical protein
LSYQAFYFKFFPVKELFEIFNLESYQEPESQKALYEKSLLLEEKSSNTIGLTKEELKKRKESILATVVEEGKFLKSLK